MDDGRERTCQNQAALLLLPIEIRRYIWKLVFFSPENPLVPRRSNRPLQGLRYRAQDARNPQFWSAMTSKIVGTDAKDWRAMFLNKSKEFMPVKNHDFCSLMVVSKAIASEVVQAFHEDTHWIFESRLDLHLFLDAIATQGDYVRSISLCLFKSQGPYSEEVKTKYESWKLGNSSPGPSLMVTIDRLQKSCPNLEYLELRPRYISRTYPVEDKKDMRNKPYTKWPWVEALTGLQLRKGFTFCPPDGQGRDEIVRECQEIEEHVNAQI